MSRQRLKDGDAVNVIRSYVLAPWNGRRGLVKGVRGSDRTWTVVFSEKPRDWSVFRREDLEKILPPPTPEEKAASRARLLARLGLSEEDT